MNVTYLERRTLPGPTVEYLNTYVVVADKKQAINITLRPNRATYSVKQAHGTSTQA